MKRWTTLTRASRSRSRRCATPRRAGFAAAALALFACANAGAQAIAAAHIAASRLFGGHWDDSVEHLVRAPDGRLYAYGRLASPFAPGVASSVFANSGQAASYVARIDPATLAIEWMVPVGRDRPTPVAMDDADRVDGFALGADGNLYVAAYAASTRYPQAGGTYVGWGGAKYLYRVDAAGNEAPSTSTASTPPATSPPTPGPSTRRSARSARWPRMRRATSGSRAARARRSRRPPARW